VLPAIRLAGIELAAVVSQYGCRPAVVSYGPVQYLQCVFCSCMLKYTISGDES